MKSTFVPLGIPDDVEELVRLSKKLSNFSGRNGVYVVVLSFSAGHSARHHGQTKREVFGSAYADLAIEALRDRKSDPRLNVISDGFGSETTIVLKTEHEHFHTRFNCPAQRFEHRELLAVAVANLYAAVDRQDRIIKAVTARLAQR
jgi:hypothetical protein